MPVRTRVDPELMPIHQPVPGYPPSKWECEAQIETRDIDDVASDYSQDTVQENLGLPLEILSIVAEYLTLSSCHATCASLAVTSHAVRQEVTPILWRTVTAWSPPRNPVKSNAEDDVLVSEMRDRWSEMVHADAARYVEYILVPPYAFDQDHKDYFLNDDYPFHPSLHHILPRLKALVYFDDFRSGPRLVVSQPHLCFCAGFRPGTEDVQGVLRLLSMVPEVLGETLIRPPWKFVLLESATSAFPLTRAEISEQGGEDGDEDEWEDVDDDDTEENLGFEEQNFPSEQSLAQTEYYNTSDIYNPETLPQYLPLEPVDLSRSARKHLEDCFPYPLTIFQFASPVTDRRDPNLVAAMFLDLLRLIMSLPQGPFAMMISIRGLILEEVTECVGALNFLVADAPPRSEFQSFVEEMFETIRVGLFAISCRGTSLDTMGTWTITREENHEVQERWRMRVLPEQKKVCWGEMAEDAVESAEMFPDEGEDVFALLSKQYANSLWGESDE